MAQFFLEIGFKNRSSEIEKNIKFKKSKIIFKKSISECQKRQNIFKNLFFSIII